MLGPEAVEQQQQPTSSVASGLVCESCLVSGVELYACIHTYTHTRLFLKANTITPPTLHWWHIIKIISPPSLCFHHVVSQSTQSYLLRTHARGLTFFSIPPSCPLWLPYYESHGAFFFPFFFFFAQNNAKKTNARLDWREWKWGGCILKGDTIRMGAAHWREASTKGACKFLTCLAYVNEPFSRSDIITTRGYCLWWKYLSRMARLPRGGEKVKNDKVAGA